MKYYFLLGFLLVWVAGYAAPEKFTLTGTLTMLTGEQFPYRIEGTEENGIIKGFAYTYSEPDETKVVIEGQVDKQGHRLSFKEIEIISSHDVHTKAFMCLLHARLEEKNSGLAGPAGSKQTDNTACTEGRLAFNNNEELLHLFSSHDKYDMEVSMGRPKTKEKQADAPVVPTATAAPAEKITAGMEKTYNWHSDSMVVEVWDGGNYDGDKITISFDGKPVLEKYIIHLQKKRFVIPLPPTGTHIFSVFADDEGSDPPNTASLSLTDGTTKYSLIAYNPKGAQSIIYVKRVH